MQSENFAYQIANHPPIVRQRVRKHETEAKYETITTIYAHSSQMWNGVCVHFAHVKWVQNNVETAAVEPPNSFVLYRFISIC